MKPEPKWNYLIFQSPGYFDDITILVRYKRAGKPLSKDEIERAISDYCDEHEDPDTDELMVEGAMSSFGNLEFEILPRTFIWY